MDENMKENPTVSKLEQTVKVHMGEIDTIRESLATYQANELKLKKRIPCNGKPCPVGRKKCLYNHDLEYKTQVDTYKKQLLCKYFANKGCRLSDEECPYSHSLEMVSKQMAEDSATGANMLPLGNKREHSQSSHNDTPSFNNLANHRIRKVCESANNDLSVELVADLSQYPANDARRTLASRTATHRDDRISRPSNLSSGNGQGTSSWRSHKEAPRDHQRPHHPQHHQRNSRPERERQRNQWERDSRRQSRERGEGTRRNYDREAPPPSYHHQPQRRRY